MRERGWYDRKGVTVLEGKWQDFVGGKLLEDMPFDAVYTDTFSEEYEGKYYICTLWNLLTRVAPQICVCFSTISRNCSPARMLDSVSSMGWERQVTYNMFLSSSGTRY